MADSTLNRFVARGTTAQRTAFTPSIPTPSSGPAQGYLFWDTDLQQEFAWDPGTAAWVVVVAAGTGTVTHTAGALTASNLVIGNGLADLKVTTTGTGIVTALGVNIGTAGAPVVNGGALGTPSSGVGTNLTGIPFTTGLITVPGNVSEGRLTTETGVPVSTTDRTAQGTLYWTPSTASGVAIGTGQITLYNGTNLVTKAITELSLALTLTSGKNYDVFIDYNAGTPQIVLSTAWTNDTTRADALATQAGIVVKSGTPAYRWVGTIRASGTNTIEDSGGITGTSQVGGKRFVWNAYNQVERQLKVIDTTDSWPYTVTGTIRQANGATGNKVEYVTGDLATLVKAQVIANLLSSNTGSVAKAGVGVDSTTTFSGLVGGGYLSIAGIAGQTTFCPLVGRFEGQPGVGYHLLSWNEKGATSATFTGDDGGDSSQSGLTASLWC